MRKYIKTRVRIYTSASDAFKSALGVSNAAGGVANASVRNAVQSTLGVSFGCLSVAFVSDVRYGKIYLRGGGAPILIQFTAYLKNLIRYGFHPFANWAELLTRGLPPPDPCSLCPLSSTEYVEPPPEKHFWVRHCC
jgi:hypothetical protein